MLAKMSLKEFAENLASGAPTPGGGSAAALAGALSASLIQMVCDLTIGREKYKAYEAQARTIRQRAEVLRVDLLALVDRDAAAYDGVIRAIRMPKASEEEKSARAEVLAKANLYATETPMAVAEACAVLQGMAIELACEGNSNAVSDAGTAALLAYAGLRGATMNIRINLDGIGDEKRAEKLRERVRRLEVDGERSREESLGAVSSRTNQR